MRASIGATLAVLLATALLAPAESRAQGWRGLGEPGTPGARSFAPAPPAIRPPVQLVPPVPPPPPRGFPGAFSTPRPPIHDRPSFRSPAVIYAAPPVIYYGAPYAPPDTADYGSAPLYDPATAYDPSLGYRSPGGQVSTSAPDPSPTPSVIQYPTGRYELRGDGADAPYAWVWIPNPPPPPPMAAPGPPAVSEPFAPPARRTTVYRWLDKEGIVHFTDSLDAVPFEYRSQVKPAPSS